MIVERARSAVRVGEGVREDRELMRRRYLPAARRCREWSSARHHVPFVLREAGRTRRTRRERDSFF